MTLTSREKIITYLNDFHHDQEFKKLWQRRLIEFEKDFSHTGGDVRFHSPSLYVITRAVRPDISIETGVASGKSFALILLGLKHNSKGRLYSIDLPNPTGNRLPDGTYATTRDGSVGWLVPAGLHDNWSLMLEDPVLELLSLLEQLGSDRVDLFFHDSLHTKEHVDNELSLVWPKVNNGGLILIDDIDTGAGEAFCEFLNEKNLSGFAYRELGGVLVGRIEED